MASNVEIANRALGELGAAKITDLEEDSPEARKVNRVFVLVRDALLRRHKWNFAMKRTSLPADSATPAFGFANQFTLPPDCLRVVEVNGFPDFKKEGHAIVTDVAPPLQLRYVARIEDPNLFDVLFAEAFAARLAMELAEDVTQSGGKVDRLTVWARDAIREAKRLDAIEDPPEDIPEEGNWLASRQQGGMANTRRFYPLG